MWAFLEPVTIPNVPIETFAAGGTFVNSGASTTVNSQFTHSLVGGVTIAEDDFSSVTISADTGGVGGTTRYADGSPDATSSGDLEYPSSTEIGTTGSSL